jgi:hypothetical protein
MDFSFPLLGLGKFIPLSFHRQICGCPLAQRTPGFLIMAVALASLLAILDLYVVPAGYLMLSNQ